MMHTTKSILKASFFGSPFHWLAAVDIIIVHCRRNESLAVKVYIDA